jgi:hypothetical protein
VRAIQRDQDVSWRFDTNIGCGIEDSDNVALILVGAE